MKKIPAAKPLVCNPIRGRRPSLMNCTVGELAVDASYQRSIDNGRSRQLIRKIAREWDWSLFQLLVVSRRPDGQLFVVDGQHRLEAARLRRDLFDLPCSIYDFASAEEEARAFRALNQERKPLSALELFKAAVAGGGRCESQRGHGPHRARRSQPCRPYQFYRVEAGAGLEHLGHPHRA